MTRARQAGGALIADINRPQPVELVRTRVRAIAMIGAAGRHDYASVYELTAKTAGEGAYLCVALAEVAVVVITAAGLDLTAVTDHLRGSAIRHQLTGGRP
jgi:hypothetical protein